MINRSQQEEKESEAANKSRDNPAFLNNSQDNSAQTKSNLIEIPSITLPKGGGAIKSIDEKFSVNAINGTAVFSLPLPVSDGRGFSPALGISYNSGAGNGIFGLGWSLNLPSIKRTTGKQLPKYLDSTGQHTKDSDTYSISEAEDLVPEFLKDESENFKIDANGNYISNEFTSEDGVFNIRRYRPRIEGLFARIERWINKLSGDIHWRVISKNNITTLYGKSASCCIADPHDPKKIFEWLIEFSYDDKGHCMAYEYKQENGIGIDNEKLHNKNRLNKNALFTNTYLKRVHYGNVAPYHNGDVISDINWMFETVLDYGDHSSILPFDEIEDTWNFRSDAFSEYRAGFEIRTCRLCKRVLLYHHFPELAGGSALIRSMDFTYTENGEKGFTFLEEVTVNGFTKHDDGTYTQKQLPPFSFTYQKHEWNNEVKSISTENLVHAPSGIDEQAYHFVDLFSEGLSGILSEQGGGWFYKRNWGGGRFTPAKLVSPKPSFSGLQNNLQLVDLEADGVKQITQWQSEPKGFFELNDEEEWQPFKAFQQVPNVDFRDPNLRLVDLNGDGKADMLITEDDVFTWYPSGGKKGFDASAKVYKSHDEEGGPAIVFADKAQSIFLADMSGDGLTDIVRIRNGDVCYWPNLGYGKFGAKTGMDNAPVFDHPEQFNPAFIRLTDIAGSGTTDIVYLGKNQFTIWLNQHGNHFLPEPKVIETFPAITRHTKVSVMDLLGTGMSCLIWNSDLPQHQNQPLRYIDLLNSKKPHILINYKNNLGKEVELNYTPSTQYYIEDKLKGKEFEWVTKLHFPVHCVSKVTVYDRIVKTRFASEYSYHHGYYDHAEREFRGFGRVDQTDAEDINHFIIESAEATNSVVDADLHQPPVLTKTWFHTGAFIDTEKILDQFKKDYNQLTIGNENLLPQPQLPDDLSIDEWRQALRSCKGMLLRKEVYANDGDAKQALPYAVEQHNCLIKFLQPKGNNKYGVFLTHESEAITYHYERNADDPRIAHSFIFDIDKYGNVLQSASVVYPRKMASLSFDEQKEMHIILTENTFTNDIQQTADYRLPLPYSGKTFEVTGVNIPKEYFQLEDLKTTCNKAALIDYEKPIDGSLQKRIIEFARQQYRADDGTGILDFGVIQSKGLPHQTYKATFNEAILNTIFDKPELDLPALKVLLTQKDKGAYILDEGYYWISSGTQNYDTKHFFLPTEFTNPFGITTRVEYETKYFLFIKKVIDWVGNEVSVENFNYRTLSPYVMKDMNDNLAAVRFDELGMVVKSFVIGKPTIDKGDEFDFTKVEMQDATDFPGAELEYEVFNWYGQTKSVGFDINSFYTPIPNYVKTTLSETHHHASADSKIQESYAYSDGSGHVVLAKVQAEPGLAMQKMPDGTCIEADAPKRWIGNGRTILNNKGNPVMQYDPYFSTTFEFDDESEMPCMGVTPVIHYDPMGRAIRADFPNKTFSKIEFTPWMQIMYDANDTVKDSDWYKNLKVVAEGTEPTDPDQRAAWLAAKHYETPMVAHFDSLGRTFLTIADKGLAYLNTGKDSEKAGDNQTQTKTIFDIEGNVLKVIDGLNRKVMVYEYGMVGNQLKQTSMDGGRRWMIHDVGGKPLLSWDDLNHEFSFEYDELGRPVQSLVKDGDGDAITFLRTDHGESLDTLTDKKATANNLRGRAYKQYDQSGVNTSIEYDFKGNLERGSKQFAKEYKKKLDWKDIVAVDLESEIFESNTEYDALNRPIKIIAPHERASTSLSIFTPAYNERGLLEQMEVSIRGTTAITFVKNIDYNAKGQREKIWYGNDTVTKYTYEKETFRLKQLLTTRKPPADVFGISNTLKDASVLQNLNYTFDPVGNITQITDNAQADIALVKALNEFEYDALYQLVSATGREHAGQTGIDNSARSDFNYRNFPFINVTPPGPNNANAFRTYTEKYQYDKVGNMFKQKHVADKAWTRSFSYESINNRLSGSAIGDPKPPKIYKYDLHGNMQNMEHLLKLIWDFHDQLQEVNLGGGGTAYYVYDASGQRVRKIIERNDGTKKERLYIGAIEIYREISSTENVTLERETLHVMDDTKRVAMIDTPIVKSLGNAETQLIRYQYDNHLGSASLELDNASKIISYEEYFPYGTTSFSTIDASRELPAKRYRYTGKERDEESGLEYHRARYYATWLGRWVSCDPEGSGGGINVYNYADNNPLKFIDINGKTPENPSSEANLAEIELLHSENIQIQAKISEVEKQLMAAADTAGKIESYNKDKKLGWLDYFSEESRALRTAKDHIAKLNKQLKTLTDQFYKFKSNIEKLERSLLEKGVEWYARAKEVQGEKALAKEIREGVIEAGGTVEEKDALLEKKFEKLEEAKMNKANKKPSGGGNEGGSSAPPSGGENGGGNSVSSSSNIEQGLPEAPELPVKGIMTGVAAKGIGLLSVAGEVLFYRDVINAFRWTGKKWDISEFPVGSVYHDFMLDETWIKIDDHNWKSDRGNTIWDGWT